MVTDFLATFPLSVSLDRVRADISPSRVSIKDIEWPEKAVLVSKYNKKSYEALRFDRVLMCLVKRD